MTTLTGPTSARTSITDTRRVTVPNPAAAPRGPRRVTVGGVIRAVGLGLWLIITLFPPYWIALSSFKSPGTHTPYPIEYWPSEASPQNYVGPLAPSSF